MRRKNSRNIGKLSIETSEEERRIGISRKEEKRGRILANSPLKHIGKLSIETSDEERRVVGAWSLKLEARSLELKARELGSWSFELGGAQSLELGAWSLEL